jgi:hypothetical protein
MTSDCPSASTSHFPDVIKTRGQQPALTFRTVQKNYTAYRMIHRQLVTEKSCGVFYVLQGASEQVRQRMNEVPRQPCT